MTDASYIPKPLIRVAGTTIEFQFLFAWFDFWVGIYYDPKNKSVYICPFPCCVFYFGRLSGL